MLLGTDLPLDGHMRIEVIPMNRLLLGLRSLCAHLLAVATCHSKTVTSDKSRVARATLLFTRYSPLAAAVVFLAFATSHSPLATAQAGDASISGLIADPSGAVIPKADVTIKNTATNVTASTASNASGLYTFPSLPPGDYVLTVHKQGFRSVDFVGLTLYTQDRLERDRKSVV